MGGGRDSTLSARPVPMPLVTNNNILSQHSSHHQSQIGFTLKPASFLSTSLTIVPCLHRASLIGERDWNKEQDKELLKRLRNI